ncbi:MAG: chemotaxis protein CheW [Candidatus Sericytochromatia bacterium]
MHIVSSAPSLMVMSFRLGEEAFALPAERVRGVAANARTTRVPGAPAWYDGVLPWRGHLVPVLNVARRLGLPEAESGVVVLVEAGGELVGLRVEAMVSADPVIVTDVEAITGAAGCAKGLGRLGDRRVVVLEPDALLTAPAPVAPFPAVADRPQSRPADGRRGAKRA